MALARMLHVGLMRSMETAMKDVARSFHAKHGNGDEGCESGNN
jgi:hypothetical protein